MATTLYLVSAETPQGEGYWKIGITKKADPLKRNPAAYRETFRAVRLTDGMAAFVEAQLKDAISLIGAFVGLEAVSGLASLESMTELFDQFVEWEGANLLCLVYPRLTAAEMEERVRFCVFGESEAFSPEANASVCQDRHLWERCEALVSAVKSSVREAEEAKSLPSREFAPMW